MIENPSSPFETIRKVLGKAGKCIYCKRSDVALSEEHIIPFGLNGNQVLLEASCGECSTITSAFERDVLRKTFILPRQAFNMRSRHRKMKDTTITATLEQNNKIAFIEIPVEDCPVLFSLPIFKPPGKVDGRPHQPGIQGIGFYHVKEIRDIPKQKLREKYGPGKIAINIACNPISFARMIAKIAYGFAVAHFGVDDIDDSGLVSAILGKTDDIGKWVGCIPKDKELGLNSVLHSWAFEIKSSYRIDIQEDEIAGDLLYKINLFSIFYTPDYTVIVGKVKNLSSKMTLPFGEQNR